MHVAKSVAAAMATERRSVRPATVPTCHDWGFAMKTGTLHVKRACSPRLPRRLHRAITSGFISCLIAHPLSHEALHFLGSAQQDNALAWGVSSGLACGATDMVWSVRTVS